LLNNNIFIFFRWKRNKEVTMVLSMWMSTYDSYTILCYNTAHRCTLVIWNFKNFTDMWMFTPVFMLRICYNIIGTIFCQHDIPSDLLGKIPFFHDILCFLSGKKCHFYRLAWNPVLHVIVYPLYVCNMYLFWRGLYQNINGKNARYEEIQYESYVQ